jgi:hypothetical protein
MPLLVTGYRDSRDEKARKDIAHSFTYMQGRKLSSVQVSAHLLKQVHHRLLPLPHGLLSLPQQQLPKPKA